MSNRAQRRAMRLATRLTEQKQQPVAAAATPVSPAQLAANRANAQLSTGPTSSEGKAKSSLNAVKTGLTGRTILLPSDDVAAYEALIERTFSRYAPANDTERVLVQRIADSEWRLLRIAPLESAIYALGRMKFADLHQEEKNAVSRAALIDGEIFIAYRRDLSNLALQERRLRSQQKSDIAELAALQQERLAAEEADAAPTVVRENGFVFSPSPEAPIQTQMENAAENPPLISSAAAA